MIRFEDIPVFIDEIDKAFVDNVDKESRRIVIYGASRAIEGTPVDTGEARSNWRATSLPAVPKGQIGAYAPGSKLGISETTNATIAQAAVGRAVNGRWKPSNGKPLTIFNNWKEIERLNDGSISQQGSHFVEDAYRTMLNLARNTTWVTKR